MPTLDPRVDAYIANSAEFAQPILEHIRAVVHAACPTVEETMKWSFPHFQYEGMLCSMASFKAHCAFGFWKAKLIIEKGDDKTEEAMGQFGRIATIKDLPTKKVLTAYIKLAMKLNDEGVKSPSRVRSDTPRPPPVAPAYFAKALAVEPAAKANFAAFSPSQKREYIAWLEEAKTEATREKRMATAVDWIAEGKKRNWKYENC
jgi:uncharacterized protein YdeI (YjbR/CyaY-like superfamily)